jgi:hypothetical protein
VFIVGDVAEPNMRAHWSAVLRGGTLIAPQGLNGNHIRGPMLSFKAAMNLRRKIFISDGCRKKHPEVTRLIENTKNWTLMSSLEDLGTHAVGIDMTSGLEQVTIMPVSVYAGSAWRFATFAI